MSTPLAMTTPLSAERTARGLTRLQLFMMSFGSIVGVGWITILGQWLSLAGPGGSVVALAMGAAAVLLVAANYAALARNDLFSKGGEIGAVAESLGSHAAFIVTVAMCMATISIVAFEAVSAGWIAVTIFPALEGAPLYRAFGRDVHAGTLAIALAGTALVAVLNLRPIAKTARAQNIIVFVKLGVTSVFIVGGVMAGNASNLLPLLPTSTDGEPIYTGILSLVATMPLWFAGFHVVAILSNERADSVRLTDVAWVMRVAIVAAGVFYVCVVLAASYVVPWQTLIAAPLPAATAFRNGLSSVTFANLVLISGLLGICSAWIACFAASVRVLNQLRKQLSGRAAEPRSATMFITVLAVILALAGRAALVPIVNVAALCFGLVYFLVSLAAWRHAVTLRQRCIAALGAVVAGSMSVYILISAVAETGWMAPEFGIVVLAVVAGSVLWMMRSKSTAYAS
ncbi:APC family permease [Steroidobacter flavus]|uniref:APC family permease n=1 Tax=Steroidobacter flavus TaxID=1842136 RepID=A0ABV8T4E6_9GAMM